MTALVGTLESGSPPVLAPSNVELIVDGCLRGEIALESARMPGRILEMGTARSFEVELRRLEEEEELIYR
ncbi:hypothetical protein [Sorangium cellulosum]|uniref:hypothetical protein n=1 Tax=Sorangium cellulosum TaxID=56 RepID=UPI001331B452|nr:hypothetical protein [Sorangium cellulosum]